MRRLVKAIDARLRRRQGIVPYSNDPERLLRISSGRRTRIGPSPTASRSAGAIPSVSSTSGTNICPRSRLKEPTSLGHCSSGDSYATRSGSSPQHFQETPAAERVQAITGELSFGSAYRFGRFEAIM